MLKNRRFLISLIIFVSIMGVSAVVLSSLSGSNKKYSLHKGDNDNQIKYSPQTGDNGVVLSPGPLTQNDTEKENNNNVPPAEKPVKKDIKAKAVYITGSSAGNKRFMEKLISLINTTELNSVVLDIKEDGRVNYESDVQSVKDIAAHHQLYNVDEVMRVLHDNGIYVIGRLVCFKDNYLAGKRGDLAIKRGDGSVWRENGKVAWTNPYNKEVWKYNIEIAKEAVKKGFDEIQFDYVRFPTARKTDVDYGENPPPKADAISGFLKEASNEINRMGVPVSADIFAIVCESPGDREGIGQVLERVGMDIDYISPMIYPSHYANASKGMMGNGVGQSINGVVFKAPDLKPYEVVYNVLLKTKDRISKVEGYKAKVRPYLQDFTASYLPKGYYQTYGPEQVKQQLKAVYDAGYEEWILWDASNSYSETAFAKE